LYFHGAGFTGEGERRMRSPATVRLLEDGRVEVLTAMTDMGQGTVAVLPMIVSESAGLAMEDVVLADPDTARVPDSGPTVASRATMVVGGVLARAAVELRERLLDWAAEGEARPELAGGVARYPDGRAVAFRELGTRYRREVGALEVTLRHEPPAWQTFDEKTYQGDAYPTFSWGADVVEVEIDPDTLQARPLKVTAVCEVGRALHKTLCAGQVEGGTLQGLGWALIEEIKLEEGRYLNDRLATYIIPTFADSPRIEVELLENPWKEGPFGAKGVGELPMDGAAPAVAAAIENACGLEVDEIPATPERLMRALEEGRSLDPAVAQET
jgi:CO/xanthine dehydrogenase Mo-binding subunit